MYVQFIASTSGGLASQYGPLNCYYKLGLNPSRPRKQSTPYSATLKNDAIEMRDMGNYCQCITTTFMSRHCQYVHTLI